MFPRHKTTNHGYQCTLRIFGILILCIVIGNKSNHDIVSLLFNFAISSQLLVLNINIILIL